jgi:succinate dehydrogenase / fumarate reductase, cytochrome b subunit
VYHNPIVRVLELGLVAAVLFHSYNGIKILLIDFFPSLTRHITVIGRTTVAVFVLSMIPITYIMGSDIVRLLTD